MQRPSGRFEAGLQPGIARADDVATVLGDQRHAARIVKRDVPDFNTGRLVKRESRIAAVSRMGAFIRIDASHRRQLPRRVAAQTDKRIADPFGLQRFFLIVFVLFGLIVGRTGPGSNKIFSPNGLAQS